MLCVGSWVLQETLEEWKKAREHIGQNIVVFMKRL